MPTDKVAAASVKRSGMRRRSISTRIRPQLGFCKMRCGTVSGGTWWIQTREKRWSSPKDPD